VEPYVFANIMFHVIRQSRMLLVLYILLENNSFQVFEVYEEVCNLHQGDKSVKEYYG